MDAPVDWPTRDLLRHRREATPERTAVVDVETGREWSYWEFDRYVDGMVRNLGVFRGDRIATVVGTRPAFAGLVFAAMRTGAVLAPCSTRETGSELSAVGERIDPDLIVCESATTSAAAAIADVPVREIDDLVPDGEAGDELTADEPMTDEPPAIEPVPRERDETFLLSFTSGTSGRPKGVRLTVGNLVASATASAFRLGVCPADRWLCALPMYHMGGLAPLIRTTLYGTTLVIQRSFEPRATADILAEHEITGVSLVPTMCKRLLDAGWTPSKSLRFVLLGGAPASEALIERCLDAGVPVYPTYGMTETASQVATATPDEVRDHPETVGQPLLGTEVTIVDATGEPLGSGETGEIVVSGPTVSPGYLDAETTATAFCENGLRTGDLGSRDVDGRLRITGRRSDRIVTGGENVDPEEVTAALESHPEIRTAAVVGLPDPEWGERVAALVVPASGTKMRNADGAEDATPCPSLESVFDHCEDRLAGFKRPKTVGYTEELPRTPSGTVDREAVRKRLEYDGVEPQETS
ncbi:acyl--CoA ligase [Halobacteria archaeon AArc-dxtr1]|nr:acyl--CoA ligase [Halobacteria archaeon AArc-dxtr1]